MAKNRILDKIIEQAVRVSFDSGKLQTKKVEGFLNEFKRLPVSEAIHALSVYKKGLERELGKETMVVESSTPLSKEEMNEVTKRLKARFTIYDLRFMTNTSLLGGLRVKIGDTVFDYSVKNSINQLRERIVSSRT